MRILKGLGAKKAPDFGAFLRAALPKSSSFPARRVRHSVVAQTAVVERGCDVDAHVVVQGAFGGDLAQLERPRYAIEVPGEFPRADLDLHDLAARDIDELGLRRDHDG